LNRLSNIGIVAASEGFDIQFEQCRAECAQLACHVHRESVIDSTEPRCGGNRDRYAEAAERKLVCLQKLILARC
jgi:hypothetical protein